MSSRYASLSVLTALALFACSSGDVTVGSTGQPLRSKADGGATGNGHACSLDGIAWSNDTVTRSGPTYEVGDTFPSPDGCNTCSCTPRGVACTELACGDSDAGPAGVCSYDGKSYGAGQSFPSTDGCNDCSCEGSGRVICTERACASDAGPPATCTYNGTTYAVGESFAIDCNGCRCDADGLITCTAKWCAP